MCLAALSVLLVSSAWSEQGDARLALVIGNASYPNPTTPLSTTLADARDLADELRRNRFEADLKTNLGKVDMQGAMDAFTGKITPGATVLLFFSGYGVQVDRQSYLLPVNADPWTAADVRKDGISLDSLLADFDRKGAKVKIVVIDAARKNPFERRFRPSPEGLAALNAPENTLALYSAVPGKLITDRPGTNSAFVSELIRQIHDSSATAEDTFNSLKATIYRASNREQVPWMTSSLIEEFYFGTQGAGRLAERPAQRKPERVTERERASEREPERPPPRQPEMRRDNAPLSHQSEVALVEKDQFRECAACPEMVVVPSGKYMMGSPEDEAQRAEYEGPRHSVEIPQRFAVGKLKVTREEFEKFVNESGYSTGDKCVTYEDNKSEDRTGRDFREPGFVQDGTHPAVCISWDDAQAYVAWLSRKTVKLYRLLAESEWEYVARAGKTTPFWWGSSISTDDANYKSDTTYGPDSIKGKWRKATVPASMFEANPWGLYQVAGNAFEWVEDCWNDNYENPAKDGIRLAESWAKRTELEVHAGGCSRRVRRGGSWSNSAWFLRAAYREWKEPKYRASNTGLRVARSLNQ
jgi:formylglycine-generating enzyme required for sulfatase activity